MKESNMIWWFTFITGMVGGLIIGFVVSSVDRKAWFINSIYNKSIYIDINKTMETKEYKVFSYTKSLTEGD